METKRREEVGMVHLEMDCVHNQSAGTMVCSWLGGAVQMVLDWSSASGAVLVRGEVRERFSIRDMTIQEFMHKQELVQSAAMQLAPFDSAA